MQIEKADSNASLTVNNSVYELDKMPQAMRGLVLMQSQSTKIRDFNSADQFNQLHQVLNASAFLIGIKDRIEPEEFKLLERFFVTKFGDVSPEEIREAFELYAAGKLDFQDKHYQSMDIVFIGGVLSSFRKFRTEVMRKAELFKRSKESEPDKDKIREEYIRNAILEPYKIFCKSGVWAFSFESKLYDFFDELGLIKISKERKKELFELARKDLISRKNETARTSTGSTRKAFFDAAEAIANAAPGKESEPIIMQAKKIAFKEYIQDCSDFDIDLDDILQLKKD